MIDPNNIVRYDYKDDELEELAIFCVCVAGKTASVIAPAVDRLLTSGRSFYSNLPDTSPLAIIRHYHTNGTSVSRKLKEHGIGCYNQKAETLIRLAFKSYSYLGSKKEIDLRTCTVDELETIKGIGPKTSRFFVMSSRPNVQHAALDTHLLKWLRSKGIDTPKSTPTGKTYAKLEQEFLSRVPDNMTPAEFDLEIWKGYANG